MISVVCPFYNEEAIIAASVTVMLQNLETLADPWELIVVNDGSRDGSLAIVQGLAALEPRLRVVTYEHNQGRGYALRTGIQHAKGDLVVTTEIDSSWGDDIVPRLVHAFRDHPDADVIIASPHLAGGGYRNVPLKRVLLSSVGNYIIRGGLTYKVTMNTGMTRAYRREKILALPLEERDKELHLEIVNKALAFGYRIYEIPAVLEWKDHKLSRPGVKRKSSSNVPRIVRTHLIFSLLAAPFRYLFLVSGALALAGGAFLAAAFYRLLFTHEVAIFLAITGFFLGLFAFLVFAVGVLAQQNRALHREIWRVQAALREQRDRDR
jgi:glycosyltransferase involved in cell wall biosynthesis